MRPIDAIERLGLLYAHSVLPCPANPETWSALKRSRIKLKRIKSSPGYYTMRLPKGWTTRVENNSPGWFTLRNSLGQPRFRYCFLLDDRGTVLQAYAQVARRFGICHDDSPSPTSYLDPASGQRRNDLFNYYLYDYETGQRMPFGPYEEEQGHTLEECQAELLHSYPDRSPDAYWIQSSTKPAWWRPRRWLR